MIQMYHRLPHVSLSFSAFVTNNFYMLGFHSSVILKCSFITESCYFKISEPQMYIVQFKQAKTCLDLRVL